VNVATTLFAWPGSSSTDPSRVTMLPATADANICFDVDELLVGIDRPGDWPLPLSNA
jgi:hypothetical protein